VLGIDEWLGNLPPMVIYLLVAVIILTESMGIPLPGEIALVSAALLASSGVVSVWGVAIGASIGAIVGDSIGYAFGRRGGRPLLERFGRRFPKHFGPTHLAKAEQMFQKWGVWAVFFGRFIALLRILAGPLSGALRVPYRKFLLANAAGGIAWAVGTTVVIYHVGRAAEKYLSGFSWVALVVAVLFGGATTLFLRRRAAKAAALLEDTDPATDPNPPDAVAAIAVEAAHDALVSVHHGKPAADRSSAEPGSATPS
jgi:membrane protein DedA with SNARE-associated domain